LPIRESSYRNARGRALLRLGIELVFPGPAGRLQERHAALIDELFGGKDEVTHTEHDEELLAASARTRKAVLNHEAPMKRAPRHCAGARFARHRTATHSFLSVRRSSALIQTGVGTPFS
jgi:hypothetical protein